MTDNKSIIEQTSHAEVAKLSQTSLPQIGASTGKATVPATTVDSLKVGETATLPEANNPYLVANIQATEPLTENSTLFDSFGPDAVNFVSIGMAEMAVAKDAAFTLKTTLKEAFGENVPYVLKILLEDQAAMKKKVVTEPVQKPISSKSIASPKIVKKVIITKAGAQAIAEVKKMDSKSTLEEVFGAEMAAKIVNSVKTEAISHITKSTTIKPAASAPAQANLVKKMTPAKIPVAANASANSASSKVPVASSSTTKQLATKPTNKKLTHYIPVKPLPDNFTKPIPAPGKPGLFILPKSPLDQAHMRSDGKQLFPGYNQPWDEWSPEEQAKFDAELSAEMFEPINKEWRARGIDPADEAAQAAWLTANPDPVYVKIKQNLIDKGLPTTSFVPLGYFESLSDKTINKFLLAVATVYTFYNYPITIYYAIALGIISWIIAFLIRYSRILERLKHDFVPDPKSRWSEAFQRDAHRRMKAYIDKRIGKKPAPKSTFKKK